MEDADWNCGHTTLDKSPGTIIPARGVPADTNYHPLTLSPAVPIILSTSSMRRCKKAKRACVYHKWCGCGCTVENMKWPIITQIAEQIDMHEKNRETSQNWKVVKVVNNNDRSQC